MKALVVYDSFFGNTERVAAEIGKALASRAEVRVAKVAEAQTAMLEGVDLLVVGSPTRKFRATPAILQFLSGLPAKRAAELKAAAFDTRVDVADIKSPVFRLIVGKAGYAAKGIAKRLSRAGVHLLSLPEGFIVLGSEGPLKAGELERAETWGRELSESMQASGAA